MWLEKRGNKYAAAWREGNRVHRKLLYTDKKASEVKLAEMIRRQERGETGLLDPYEIHRNRPIMEHVQDWVLHLNETRKSDVYIRLCEGRMARLVKDCRWEKLGDISSDDFEDWREMAMIVPVGFVADKNVKVTTLSARAKNHYFQCLRTFCRWCVKKKRMAENPMVTVEELPEEGEERRARRALTEDELSRLLAVIPIEFRLVYTTAVFTGLRRSELESLRWSDLHLDSPRPFIKLRAETTKSKRGDTLPLRSDLAEWLKEAQAQSQGGEQVFTCIPSIGRHKTWLGEAGIAWIDDRGRRADFHALRTTLCTLLNKAGVNIQTAMAIMRHTDIRLTTRTYTDVRLFDTSGAVEGLRGIQSADDLNQGKILRTGTDDLPESEKPASRNEKVANRVATATLDGQKLALTGGITEVSNMGDSRSYTASKAGFGVDRHTSKNTAMGGNRTLTPCGTGT